MISAILEIVGSALSIWDSKLKQKYIDKKIDLERKYYAAINEPEENRNNALIDNLEFEIILLAKALSLDMTKKQ
jgi:hypothetical protein